MYLLNKREGRLTLFFCVKLILVIRRFSMYEGGKGAVPVVAGSVILPNTGGSQILTFVAITSIVVGLIIILSSVALFLSKKFSKVQ